MAQNEAKSRAKKAASQLQPSDSKLSRRKFLQTGAILGITSVASTSAGCVDRSEYETIPARWTVETEGKIFSSPTIVDGTVFVGVRKKGLYALDSDTGEKEWQFDKGRAFNSSPAVGNDSLFIYDEHVDSLTKAGETTWVDESKTNFFFTASPTLVDDTLYLGGSDDFVYALDAKTGTERWKYKTDSMVRSTPAVTESTVFVGSEDFRLYALDVATGNQRWSFTTDSFVRTAPTVAAGTVYFGSYDGHVYALETETGKKQWEFDTGNQVQSSPTVHGERVYIGGGATNSHLYALDSSTGDMLWRYETDGTGLQSSPTVVEDTVCVGGEHVYGIDTATGDVRWRFETAKGGVSSPTVVDGTLYIGDMAGRIYALDAGLDGSSEGSRVKLGTLGHHDG